eukprot:gb/GEZN01001846.1/.p1 GENE.gb/GEZN01001846.1/~~gb/GEZN01001846.1/.p1  ORF type:complete len:421 (-),score=49.65 gb/GEZN01001846.1/:1282-2544(-)
MSVFFPPSFILGVLAIICSSVLLLTTVGHVRVARRWAVAHSGKSLGAFYSAYIRSRLIGSCASTVASACLAMGLAAWRESTTDPAVWQIKLFLLNFEFFMNLMRFLFCDLIGSFLLLLVKALLPASSGDLERKLWSLHFITVVLLGVGFFSLTIAAAVLDAAWCPAMASMLSMIYYTLCTIAMWFIYHRLYRVRSAAAIINPLTGGRFKQHLRRLRIYRNLFTLALAINIPLRISSSTILRGHGNSSYWATWDPKSDMMSMFVGNFALFGFVYMSHVFQKEALAGSEAQPPAQPVTHSSSDGASSGLHELHFRNVHDRNANDQMSCQSSAAVLMSVEMSSCNSLNAARPLYHRPQAAMDGEDSQHFLPVQGGMSGSEPPAAMNVTSTVDIAPNASPLLGLASLSHLLGGSSATMDYSQVD